MPSTFLSLHYHIIFSTKHREPIIDPAWRTALHEYLGGIVRGLDAYPQGCDGIADHVHLLVGLKATHRLSDFLRELKKASSSWVRENHLPSFCWQEGYAAFTVSSTNRKAVQSYIRNQEEHHHTNSFREELIELLIRAGIAYEEKYLD